MDSTTKFVDVMEIASLKWSWTYCEKDRPNTKHDRPKRSWTGDQLQHELEAGHQRGGQTEN